MKISPALYLLFALIFNASTTLLSAQDIVVHLEPPSLADNTGFDLVFLESRSNEEFILPEETTGALFLNLEQFAIEGDRRNSLLFIPSDSGHLVYVDQNNDENLNNDGAPLFFPHEANALDFTLKSKDGHTTSPFRLEKIPGSMLDDPEMKSKIVDEHGRLQEAHFKVWKLINPDVSKERNYFFHVTIVNLRRGVLELGSKRIDIGLYDNMQNGRYDDTNADRLMHSDWLLVDTDGDKRLNAFHEEDTFLLDEILLIDGKNYKLKDLDPAGDTLTLTPTNEKRVKLFSDFLDAQRAARN